MHEHLCLCRLNDMHTSASRGTDIQKRLTALRLAFPGREAALEGCKAELVASQQQVASQGQQLEALNGRLTQQTAELHTAQSLVSQLRQQV